MKVGASNIDLGAYEIRESDRVIVAVGIASRETIAAIKSRKRRMSLRAARIVALVLMRERTELTMAEVGAALGGREGPTMSNILRIYQDLDGRTALGLRVKSVLDDSRAILEDKI